MSIYREVISCVPSSTLTIYSNPLRPTIMISKEDSSITFTKSYNVQRYYEPSLRILRLLVSDDFKDSKGDASAAFTPGWYVYVKSSKDGKPLTIDHLPSGAISTSEIFSSWVSNLQPTLPFSGLKE
jgi:hypothetical protein